MQITCVLWTGTMGGDRSSAETLLKHGADVNVTDKTGKSALMIAVVNGHMGMVEALLEAGADLQIKNEVSCAPLCLRDGARRRSRLFIFHACLLSTLLKGTASELNPELCLICLFFVPVR